jgi:hypothetical protein
MTGNIVLFGFAFAGVPGFSVLRLDSCILIGAVSAVCDDIALPQAIGGG